MRFEIMISAHMRLFAGATGVFRRQYARGHDGNMSRRRVSYFATDLSRAVGEK